MKAFRGRVAILTRVDLLTLGSTMIGASHFGVALDVGVLLTAGTVFLVVGARRFSIRRPLRASQQV